MYAIWSRVSLSAAERAARLKRAYTVSYGISSGIFILLLKFGKEFCSALKFFGERAAA
jgi:hypothetical protein